jgi:hypothetical protein
VGSGGVLDLHASGAKDLVYELRLAYARNGLKGHGGRDRSKFVARFALKNRTLELLLAHRLPL